MGRDRPLTRREFSAWVAGGAFLIIAAGWVFFVAVLGRAEAASERVEDRIEKRLEALESKVDGMPQRLIDLLKDAGVIP